MDYKKYQISRDLSWEILIQEHITQLPVRISTICKKMNIHVETFSGEDNNAGFSMIVEDMPHIFVNSNHPVSRQRFTAAHELGHILLGHVGKFELVNREPDPTDHPIERDANMFAARLLAPACVLWGCNVQSADQIASLCDISYKAAEYRMRRMQVLYQRNKFLLSPMERKVYDQFAPFIAEHKF